MAQHQVEIPVPGRVVDVGELSHIRDADNVDDSRERVAKQSARLGEHSFRVRARGDVGLDRLARTSSATALARSISRSTQRTLAPLWPSA